MDQKMENNQVPNAKRTLHLLFGIYIMEKIEKQCSGCQNKGKLMIITLKPNIYI